jgi:hypothetical protein
MDSGWHVSVNDAELLELVAVATAITDPPAWVAAAGRAAYIWLSFDTDVETLLAGAGQPDRPTPA